jgi:hypothetical protein
VVASRANHAEHKPHHVLACCAELVWPPQQQHHNGVGMLVTRTFLLEPWCSVVWQRRLWADPMFPCCAPTPHLQAVFSRPVIALGSDWGSKELQADLVSLAAACEHDYNWVRCSCGHDTSAQRLLAVRGWYQWGRLTGHSITIMCTKTGGRKVAGLYSAACLVLDSCLQTCECACRCPSPFPAAPRDVCAG